MTTYNLDIIIKAIDQASANLKTVGGSLGTLGQEASSAAQSLQPLGLGLAALSATGATLIGTAALTAARVEVLGTVLETVGGNAGYSAEELAAFEASLMETGITAGASRQGLIQMAQAEIDLSHATDLARLAQDAAVIANLNSSEAYERLITGIQRGEIELLKTMGLTVDFNGAYKRMAAQLGKTTLELSAGEKMQARLNETMKAGEAISGVYIAAMGDVGKKLGSVKGDIQDAANALGQAYLPAMEGAIDATRAALGWFTDLDAATQRNIATFLGLGTAVTGAAGGLILIIPKIVALHSALVVAGPAMAGLATSTLAFIAPVAAAAAPLIALTAAILAANAAMEGHHEKTIALSSGYEQYIDMMRKTGRATLILTETQWESAKMLETVETATSDLTDGWTGQYSPALIEARTLTDGWNTSLELARRPLGELGEATVEATDDVAEYTRTLGLLKESLEGPVAKANEQYTAEQVRISHELIEARNRLVELDAKWGDHQEEIAETEATLVSLEGELVSLDAQHRAVMNQIVYDMMMARLATEGWTAAETELALETARAMGIIDEETWAAATNMNAALDSFAEGESVANTMDAILGIGGELSGLEPIASEAGAGIGASISSGAQEGASAIDGITGAVNRIPRHVKIDVVTHYSTRGRADPSGELGYQHGTDYVPRTGWAYLHRGEAVLPAPVAAQYRAGDTNINLTANYAYQSERHLRDDVRMLQLLVS